MGDGWKFIIVLLVLVLLAGLTQAEQQLPDLPSEPGGLDFTTGAAVNEESAQQSFISVAAINMKLEDSAPDDMWDDLEDKIDELFDEHPDGVDLIVTPEYLFYGAGFYGIDYRNDPVIVDCDQYTCKVLPLDTSKSMELAQIINEIVTISRLEQTNIVLGTIAETDMKSNIDGVSFTFDTQLIISKGQIVGKHRMYPLVYPRFQGPDFCKNNPETCDKAKELILETVQSFPLTTRDGRTFRIIPFVCGEKNEDEVINRLKDANADIAVISEFDVECNYRLLSRAINSGVDVFAREYDVCAQTLSPIFNKWDANNLLKSRNVVIAEGNLGSAGVFNYWLRQTRNLDTNEHYTYGRVPGNFEIENCCYIEDFTCEDAPQKNCEANDGLFIHHTGCEQLRCPIIPEWATLHSKNFTFNLSSVDFTMKIDVEADYIYKYFYVFNESGNKTKYQFNEISNMMYIGNSTSGSVPVSAGSAYYVAAYACNRLSDDEFDCNNKRWMLKKIVIPDCGNRILGADETKENCPADYYFKAGGQTRMNNYLYSRTEDNVTGIRTAETAASIIKWISDTFSEENENLLCGDKETVCCTELRTCDHNIVMNRMAQSIVEEINYVASSDHAILFRALSIWYGVPVKYIQTVDKDWLDDKLLYGWDDTIEHYTLVEVYLNEEWKVLDIKSLVENAHQFTLEEIAEIIRANDPDNPYTPERTEDLIIQTFDPATQKTWLVTDEGLDAWDMGYHYIGEMKAEIFHALNAEMVYAVCLKMQQTAELTALHAEILKQNIFLQIQSAAKRGQLKKVHLFQEILILIPAIYLKYAVLILIILLKMPKNAAIGLILLILLFASNH
jgi:hypothetical protein